MTVKDERIAQLERELTAAHTALGAIICHYGEITLSMKSLTHSYLIKERINLENGDRIYTAEVYR